VELLRREPNGAVAVGGILQHREARLDLRRRDDLDALGRHGVDRHARGAEALIVSGPVGSGALGAWSRPGPDRPFIFLISAMLYLPSARSARAAPMRRLAVPVRMKTARLMPFDP
jgi:hypothetical protein